MKRKSLITIYILGLLVLFFRLAFFFEMQSALESDKWITITTRLQQGPYLVGETQRFSIKTDRAETVTIITTDSQSYSYGQELSISGVVMRKDLGTYSVWQMYYPHIAIKKEPTSSLMEVAANIRIRSRELFERTLPEPSGQLLMGIVFGSKEHFSKSFQNNLQVAGVLHVIAASGMNVSFVTETILVFFGMFLRRKAAIFFAIIGILFYTLLVGFQASILRASLMALLACGASFLGRQQWGVFALILTGYFMLIWQPRMLLDKGFQLSFLATLAILTLNPVFFLKKNAFTEDVGTTVSAQLGTLPILVGTFGRYGLLSLFVNLLVLWTVPPLLFLGSLAVICSYLFYPLGKWIVYLSWPLLVYFEKIVSVFGSIQLIISLTDVPLVIWLGYYLIGFSLIMFIKKHLSVRAEAIVRKESL